MKRTTSKHTPNVPLAKSNPRQSHAWIASANIDSKGKRVINRKKVALQIVTVCVHRDAPHSIADRAALMNKIAQCVSSPLGTPTLWVFPGGYFNLGRCDVQSGLDKTECGHLAKQLRKCGKYFPSKSTVIFGVDTDSHQEVWVTTPSSPSAYYRIRRGSTPLVNRVVDVGNKMKATIFVCGEFTGSKAPTNGPYDLCNGKKLYLDDLSVLRNSQVLVDVAHCCVPGTVNKTRPSWRMAHQRQMERFSKIGVAVLAHHHFGSVRNNRPMCRHQSNWVVFKGGERLNNSDVKECCGYR